MEKKKYKLKVKNVKILGIVILILLAVFLFKPTVNVFSLMGKDYSFSEAVEIHKSGLYDKIVKKGYSEVVANTIGDKDFKEENLDIYYKVKYYSYKDFLVTVNKLIKQGYDNKEIDIINEKNDQGITDYLTSNYVEHIDEWLKFDYFKSENIDRYLDSFDGSYKDTIVRVNIGLDKDFYEDVNVIKEFSVNVLANKYNKLDETFVPSELTPLSKCSGSNHFLSKEAKEAYDKLCDATIEAGLSLSVTSSYRSYESQQEVYDEYFKLYGQSYVDKYVAVPGYSEHQTGLALDLKSKNSNIFKNSKEYTWMLENAYKYGFILRYPESKKEITGYNSEAWHFRYVGVDAAKYIQENKITYDEYYVMFLDK